MWLPGEDFANGIIIIRTDRCRPEQLNLQPSPSFNIDLDLGFDFSGFETNSTTEHSSLLSPRTLASSQTSIQADEHFLEPASPLRDPSSGDIGDGFDFVFDDIEQATTQNFHQQRDRNIAEPGVDEQFPNFAGRDRDQDDLMEMTEDGTVIFREASGNEARLPDASPPRTGDVVAEMQDDDFELMGDRGEIAPDDMVTNFAFIENNEANSSTARSSNCAA